MRTILGLIASSAVLLSAGCYSAPVTPGGAIVDKARRKLTAVTEAKAGDCLSATPAIVPCDSPNAVYRVVAVTDAVDSSSFYANVASWCDRYPDADSGVWQSLRPGVGHGLCVATLQPSNP